MDWHDIVKGLVQTVVYGIVGIALFMLALWLIAKLSPFSARKEIEEDQNMAFGIIVGSVLIGIALIVAAAIHG